MTTTTKFETGATSHAVNDLILFTDNTRELVELRDSIYSKMYQFDLMSTENSWDNIQFIKLLKAAQTKYMKEFPSLEDNSHIRLLSSFQQQEYCTLYLADFNNWKSEHGYK